MKTVFPCAGYSTRKLTRRRFRHVRGQVQVELEHVAGNDFHYGVRRRGRAVLPLHLHGFLPRVDHVKRYECLLVSRHRQKNVVVWKPNG